MNQLKDIIHLCLLWTKQENFVPCLTIEINTMSYFVSGGK